MKQCDGDERRNIYERRGGDGDGQHSGNATATAMNGTMAVEGTMATATEVVVPMALAVKGAAAIRRDGDGNEWCGGNGN